MLQDVEFTHHGLSIVLDDDWWAEAGMSGFTPSSTAYHADDGAFPGRRIFQVRIIDVGSVLRSPGVGIFNDNCDPIVTARKRVVSILLGFRSGSRIPPVEIVKAEAQSSHPYKLVHGTHRLYCSLAVGFTHVPAVEGFDITALDR